MAIFKVKLNGQIEGELDLSLDTVTKAVVMDVESPSQLQLRIDVTQALFQIANQLKGYDISELEFEEVA